MKQIDSLDQWFTFTDLLSAAGYRLQPVQRESNNDEGYLVHFIASGRPDLEVTTTNVDVYNAMVNFKRGNFERG
ncbi:MAG: hypothetical protein GXY20_10170 [Clostridiales bacterium]|nr:hypothetical protein [Clostridiales bacterium]